MKVAKCFYSMMSILFLFLAAQSAFAGLMKYTYQSSVMKPCCELTIDQEGVQAPVEFFEGAEEQFEIEFIIPEIDFLDLLTSSMTFENPVTRVTSTNLFSEITINSSQFYIEGGEYEGSIYVAWWLYLDITDNSFPNGMTRHALFEASGGSSDYMEFLQENFYHRRCAGQYPPEMQMDCWEGIFDSRVEFSGNFEGPYLPEDQYPGGIYRLYGQRISVPEPFAPLLLLTGLAGIFFVRRVKFDI